MSFEYCRFPVRNRLAYTDLCMIALHINVKKSGKEEELFEALPKCGGRINMFVPELRWLFNNNLAKYPFGIDLKPNEQIVPEKVEEMKGIIQEYIINYHRMVEELNDAYIAFQQEAGFEEGSGTLPASRGQLGGQISTWFDEYYGLNQIEFRKPLQKFIELSIWPVEDMHTFRLEMFEVYLRLWQYQMPVSEQIFSYDVRSDIIEKNDALDYEALKGMLA